MYKPTLTEADLHTILKALEFLEEGIPYSMGDSAQDKEKQAVEIEHATNALSESVKRAELLKSRRTTNWRRR